jgi:transketolase
MTLTTNDTDRDHLLDLISRMDGAEKHGPAAYSTLDVLQVLYDRVLRVTPETAEDEHRDRFLLSKGHGPMAYYAVLAAKGFINEDLLPGFGSFDSPLGHHPDRTLVPGVEIGSGSLGHGLPLGVGTALGLRAQGLLDPAVWVLLGDAELDEGSNHEAIAMAGAAGLSRLHAVVIDNDSATHGWTGGIASRFEAAGWSATTVDGRDREALFEAFTAPHPDRPHVVVAVVEPKPASQADDAPPPSTMRERFISTTTALLDEDPRLAVVLADISASGFEGAHRAHPDRVVNVGIREQLLIGAAGGLALTGMRPIAHTFASFLVERPFEQVKLDLGHQGVGAVLVSALGSYDWPAGGRTHMSPGDVALLDTLPDWTVHVPGHPDEAELLLRDAAAGDGLVYVRLSLQQNTEPQPITPGRFLTVRQGSGTGPVVVAVGPMLDAVLEATAGLDATVLYAATVRPFDDAALRAAVAGAAGTAEVVLVEPYLAGTSVPFATAALDRLPHRVLGLGTAREELRNYGTRAEHLAAHGLDPHALRERIAAWVSPSAAAAPRRRS